MPFVCRYLLCVGELCRGVCVADKSCQVSVSEVFSNEHDHMAALG